MSGKRSRAAFEADLQAQQSPFVLFGTPLPPLDPDVRDDGSYVPVWKQEVRDEQGRRRLHGAFTGGFSAGYYNTVGSKEGWTPSTFVSSRSSRRKDDPNATKQRVEDFMDEEDLADAEESRKIHTSQAFAGLGLTENDAARTTGLAGLFRVEGETMGTRLLKKMGWKEGQGIGPKVRRAPELGMRAHGAGDRAMFLFAPENVSMVSFVRKTDRKGLGFQGQGRLAPIDKPSKEDRAGQSDEDEHDIIGPPRKSLSFMRKSEKKDKKSQGGIGIGILNDTGSDDEDPYEIGPRISYNRVIGGTKKKKKKDTTAANPSLRAKPVFVPKSSLARVAQGVRKCHDGRLPLDGFTWGREAESSISSTNPEGSYPPPVIPPGWKSSKAPAGTAQEDAQFTSTADAAKASAMDPKSRAAALGEKQLPGKSVFDFISASARDRLVSATGRADLPQGLGQVPAGYTMTDADKLQELLSNVPTLDKDTAVAAITRGASGSAPYADSEAKSSRYRAYLEYYAGLGKSLPAKPQGMPGDDWLREFHEFFNCARIFKPMTGFMASRFTTSSSSTSKFVGGGTNQDDNDKKELVSKPAPKPLDPAEEAARMGMYGHMTRSVADFFPTRLLCKRFGVRPPVHAQAAAEEESGGPAGPAKRGAAPYPGAQGESGNSRDATGSVPLAITGSAAEPRSQEAQVLAQRPVEPVVDASRNEALEGARAGEEVFKAIFGDSSDEEGD